MHTTDALKIDIAQSRKGVTVTLHGSASMELCDQLSQALVEACEHRPRILAVVMTELERLAGISR